MLPFIYSSGGRRTVFVRLERGEKKTWHTRKILSSPQEIILFERVAGPKIGKPQTMELDLIAQIL